jgi:replicative DNA helicase
MTREATKINKLLTETYLRIQEREVKFTSGKSPVVSGIKLGYRYKYIDRLTLGLRPSETTVIAAEDAELLTNFVLNIADSVLREDAEINILLISTRLARQAIVERLLSIHGFINYLTVIQQGEEISSDDWVKITLAIGFFGKSNLSIADPLYINGANIGQIIEKAKDDKKADLIILDSLDYYDFYSDITEVSDFSYLAKMYEVPIIATTSLLSGNIDNIRSYGTYGVTGSVVAYLEPENDIENSDAPHIVTINLIKNRNGLTGSNHMMYHPDSLVIAQIDKLK